MVLLSCTYNKYPGHNTQHKNLKYIFFLLLLLLYSIHVVVVVVVVADDVSHFEVSIISKQHKYQMYWDQKVGHSLHYVFLIFYFFFIFILLVMNRSSFGFGFTQISSCFRFVFPFLFTHNNNALEISNFLIDFFFCCFYFKKLSSSWYSRFYSLQVWTLCLSSRTLGWTLIDQLHLSLFF